MKTYFFALLAVGFIISSCHKEPQPEKPDPVRRKSPIAITSVTYKPTNTYVKVVYGQPYTRGRQIFGDLVPYGQIWRTGANEATELTTTGSIVFNGNQLEAGTYDLFTIPRKNQPWTVVLNDSLGQWGAFDYNQQYDHLRTEVPAIKAEHQTEAFTIQFSDLSGNATDLIIRWDTTEVRVPIEFVSK